MMCDDEISLCKQLNKRGNILYLVVPCYNEEEVLPLSADVMKNKLERLMKAKRISDKSKIIFVNDGSEDSTWKIIDALCRANSMFSGLSFSRNFGHQSAILAGMLQAAKYADMVVTIDADLQQDIESLDAFIEAYQGGCEIVYGVRNDRSSDGWFKKSTANIFYGFMNLLHCEVMKNHADYRLLSAKAIEALSEYKEVNLFLRGLIPTVGFQSDIVYFDVKKREAGVSKYTLGKMMKLAWDGLTSMSVRPIQMITIMGVLVSISSVVLILIIFAEWAAGKNVPGYTTSLMVSLLMGGLTIYSLGIVGEYIGKIYMETKHRPRYIVDAVIWRDKDKETKTEMETETEMDMEMKTEMKTEMEMEMETEMVHRQNNGGEKGCL